MTCTDAAIRAKVEEAWVSGLVMSDWASKNLGNLKDKLPASTVKDKLNPENQRFIAAEDPAFTQIFMLLTII